MILTAKQIKDLDEISIDRKTADATLNIALTFHSNCLNEVEKRAKQWWDEIIELHDLDRSIVWAVKNGEIVKKEDDR